MTAWDTDLRHYARRAAERDSTPRAMRTMWRCYLVGLVVAGLLVIIVW